MGEQFDQLLTIGHSWLAPVVAFVGGLGALFLRGVSTTPRRYPSVLAGLMIAVGLLAIALAAVHDPSDLWMRIMTTLVPAILAAAIVPALIRCGRERSYWVGFLICGWLCFLFHFGANLKLGGFPQSPLDSFVLDVGFARLTAMQRARMSPSPYRSRDLVFIGYALSCLLSGLVGGKLARFLTPPDSSSMSLDREAGRIE